MTNPDARPILAPRRVAMSRPIRSEQAATRLSLYPLLAGPIAAIIITILGASDVSAHDDRNYAVIFETSTVYRGLSAKINHYDPDLGTGSFTNSSLWAVDVDTCGSDLSWVEAGWSKRSSWSGQLRHKFMWQVGPTPCTFTIWPFNLGTPSAGQLYEYRLVYNGSANRWDMYTDGVLKAAKATGWVFADYLSVGGELAPVNNGTIDLGPSNAQQLQYQLSGGSWVDFFYEDSAHCDIDPPLLPYNLIHPVNSPTWIYFWGPAEGGVCP